MAKVRISNAELRKIAEAQRAARELEASIARIRATQRMAAALRG